MIEQNNKSLKDYYNKTKEPGFDYLTADPRSFPWICGCGGSDYRCDDHMALAIAAWQERTRGDQ